MIPRKPIPAPTEPDYRVLRGCWVGSGMACRVWYIQGGQVRMTFSEGMLTYQIDNAIRQARGR
jgi:hypothetical protein